MTWLDDTKTRLAVLIDQIATAKEGSGKLDDAIFEGMKGYRKAGVSSVDGGMFSETAWITGAPDEMIGGQVLLGKSPSYTFNIAAARSLVESGMLLSVEGNAGDYQQGKYGKARIWCSPEYSKIESMARINVEAEAATPALAVCLAAVKARLAGYG